MDNELLSWHGGWNKEYLGVLMFPGCMILDDPGEVKIYYGAADTVECLAADPVVDLLELCGVTNRHASGCRTKSVQERELVPA